MASRDPDMQRVLNSAALSIDATLSKFVTALLEKVCSLKAEIRRIEALSLMSEEAERAKALAPSFAVVAQKTAAFQKIQNGSRLGVVGAPVQAFNCFLELRQARAAHTEAIRMFESPEQWRRRSEKIKDHNDDVETERGRLKSLRADQNSRERTHEAVVQFREDAGAALLAATGDGWIASDFSENFNALASEVKSGRLGAASEFLTALVFQRQPTADTYDRWLQEAKSVRERAYSQFGGMAASGAYPEIVGRSIQLSYDVLRPKPLRDLLSFAHAADQWQTLSSLLADPRSFNVDALWAIYWSMFQCGEWAASALSETDPHEDVFTGQLVAQIDQWLANWAAERVRQFGYPEMRSYMGTLALASKGEETRLGADLGVIVDLNIGGLTCRKVALFQAKMTRQGVADVGSESGQLPKLLARPRIGFYLFYHQSQYPLRSPAPTICSAQALAESVIEAGKRLDASYLPVNVRSLGWDWASFVSFGLCQPASSLGASFGTIDDALATLGEGNHGHLPKYLHVISIADEPRVLELRQKVHAHYIDRADRRKEMRHAHSPRKSREIDGPELSM